MISATVFGNVGSDPEMATTSGGTDVLKFSVASNAGHGDQKTTTWVKVAVFGKQAGSLRSLVAKGNRVIATGRLKAREWTGRDGGKRTDVELDADNVQIVDYPEQQAAAPTPAQARAPMPQPPRQVSPDGLHEWTGQAWVPRAQAAPMPPPAMPPPPPQAGATVPF